MPLIVTLNNCAHINVMRADSTPLLSFTLEDMQEPIRGREAPLMQRLKWLIRDYREAGGTMTKAAIRTYLQGKDLD